MATLNLLAGWIGMVLGVMSGAVIGLFFHRDGWLGGYGAYRRRMVRLGHIAFFGLGFVNLFFAFTWFQYPFPGMLEWVASVSLIIGAATMPAICFLSAWKQPFKSLFPIPVLGVSLGIGLVLFNLISSLS